MIRRARADAFTAAMVESSTVDFGFSTEVKVRFAETDAQGIAHHAVYLVWFEVARIEYLARFRGGYPELQAEGIEALTLEANVSFRAPARFDDRLVISARCSDVRGARFRFDYRVERGGELVAEGSTGHACAAARTLRPTRVPQWLVDEIAKAEPMAQL
jgi:acyl-CoA thioester hydrolase